MKKITAFLFSVMMVFALSSLKSEAQTISVNARLSRPSTYERNERDRPNRPSWRHVWINEEWVSVNGGTVYHPGYWGLPPRRGLVWQAGRWDPSPQYRGKYDWVPGHWRPDYSRR